MKQLRFLIARVDRIGDVVLSTPLPREIKKKYPDSFVAILVRHYTKDVYLNNPNVDAIIEYDNPDKSEKIFWSLVTEIRKYHFTHAFMLLPQEKLNYVLFFSGIPYRAGVGHKLYQVLTFTKYVDRKKYIPLRHEADYCLDMIREIGVDVTDINPEIYLSKDEQIQVSELKNSNRWKNKILIGVHTTSGNSAPNLTVQVYRDLINILAKNPDYQIFVTDLNPADELKQLPKVEYIFDIIGLRRAIIHFSMLDVLISNSTGPMHICAALKVPTFSIFCPLPACSPKLWGPLGNKSKTILPKQSYCETQCPGDPKRCDYSREGGFTAEEISESINNFLLNN